MDELNYLNQEQGCPTSFDKYTIPIQLLLLSIGLQQFQTIARF